MFFSGARSYFSYKTKIRDKKKSVFSIPPLPEGGGGYIVLRLSVLPSVQDIFRRIFLSNCWWQKSDIWSQASYRYPISFLDPSDSYFLFAEERGYHKWALAHSSSCFLKILLKLLVIIFQKYMSVQCVEWALLVNSTCVKWSELIMTLQVYHTVSSQTASKI
jgi:hypothetical protein